MLGLQVCIDLGVGGQGCHFLLGLILGSFILPEARREPLGSHLVTDGRAGLFAQLLVVVEVLGVLGFRQALGAGVGHVLAPVGAVVRADLTWQQRLDRRLGATVIGDRIRATHGHTVATGATDKGVEDVRTGNTAHRPAGANGFEVGVTHFFHTAQGGACGAFSQRVGNTAAQNVNRFTTHAAG